MTARPRITRQEAQYLTEVLTESKKILDQFSQYTADLESEVKRLEQYRRCDPYLVMKEGYTNKLAALEHMKYNLGFLVSYHRQLHELLIKKYGCIANGVKQQGPYRHTAYLIEDRYRHSNKDTYKQLANLELPAIETIGKKPKLTVEA